MKKLTDGMYRTGQILEIIMGFFVLAAVVIGAVKLVPEFLLLWQEQMNTELFLEFLEMILNLVIGIEFLKMLLRPNTDMILEVLVFVIARHMVVRTTTSWEDFLSVTSVLALLLVQKYLDKQKGDTQEAKNIESKTK
ncbi:MAG: hypothetical protein ACI4S1_02705 [Roseburia sp.]|uniref:hypothetical protein n=1 Tax=Roseburia hominis TaxID=301301 RepID=UPI001F2241A0|nr:hypothetical protein [Roseburia hominis]MCI5713338.1 hypothetical protein [Lachnospiraceae bacterium]